jgi:hypothetical protein
LDTNEVRVSLVIIHKKISLVIFILDFFEGLAGVVYIGKLKIIYIIFPREKLPFHPIFSQKSTGMNFVRHVLTDKKKHNNKT